MSHFSVLIIGNDPEKQLEPYWELDLPDDELRQDPRAEFITAVPAGQFEEKSRQIIADIEGDQPRLAAHYRQLLSENRTEDLLKSWFGGVKSDVGDWGYYENPNAKWDSFAFGGRWAGRLILKPGRSGVLSPEGREGERRFSPLEVDQASCGAIHWAKTRKTFLPFAVLKRGQWHQQGEMGWFGIARNCKKNEVWEEEVSRLLNDVSAEELVSVYDCHI